MIGQLPVRAALSVALLYGEMRRTADRPRTKHAIQAEAALFAATDAVAWCGFAPEGYDVRLVLGDAFHDVGNMPTRSRPEWATWCTAIERHIIDGLAARQPSPSQQGESHAPDRTH
jgi:hypothetical protein